MQPDTRYADSGGVNIAYQVVGDGPRDLVLVPGWASNIEVYWEEPAFARFLAGLVSFSRLILFDKRGTGSRTESRTCRALKCAWMTCARSWTPWARSKLHFLAYPRGDRCARSSALPILTGRQP